MIPPKDSQAHPCESVPYYATMSRKGASPLPNESNDTFSSETCKNQPTNPLMNSQFRASGLNLAENEISYKKVVST